MNSLIGAIGRESKRKTAAVVSLRNGDRLFGDPALNTVRKNREEGGYDREGGLWERFPDVSL